MKVYQRDERWYVDFTYRGKRYRRSAGRTKRQALSKLGEIQRQIEDEERSGVPANAPRTFADFAAEYLVYSKASKAESTYRRERSKMNRLLEAFGSTKLEHITVREIERYKIERSKKRAPATVNLELALLRHMFTKAADWDYFRKPSPALRVKLLKRPAGRMRYLSLEEREVLLDDCKQSENPLLFPMVLTALETGMRKGEQQRVCWEDVEFTRRLIWLRQTKNNETRAVPINDRLLPVLERLYLTRAGRYVFAKPDGTPYGDWDRSFKTALRHVGIKDFRWHDLRHTFASYLVMSGVDIRSVQELMGHKTIMMTMRYSHLSRPHLLEASNKIGTLLAQCEGKSPAEFAKSRI